VNIKIIGLMVVAMFAFAGNSLLCRLALGQGAIDAASFSSVRIVSGAVTSGLGYVIWYAALRELPATQAASIQLSVPIIAAIGGAILLSEVLTIRLVVASIATLGGISIVLAQKVAKAV